MQRTSAGTEPSVSNGSHEKPTACWQAVGELDSNQGWGAAQTKISVLASDAANPFFVS